MMDSFKSMYVRIPSIHTTPISSLLFAANGRKIHQQLKKTTKHNPQKNASFYYNFNSYFTEKMLRFIIILTLSLGHGSFNIQHQYVSLKATTVGHI